MLLLLKLAIRLKIVLKALFKTFIGYLQEGDK